MLISICTACKGSFNTKFNREDGLCPRCINGACNFCGQHPDHAKEMQQRATQAEAGAAAMREALEVAYQHLDRYGVAESRIPNDPLIPSQERVFAAYHKAKKVDAGAALLERLRRAEDALAKINEIRNDVVGRQAVGFSQHVYPLVAALEGAGIRGAGYEKARRAVLDFKRLLLACQSLWRRTVTLRQQWLAAERDAQEWAERAQQHRQERDAARVEVESLKAKLADAVKFHTAEHNDRMNAEDERDAARAEVNRLTVQVLDEHAKVERLKAEAVRRLREAEKTTDAEVRESDHARAEVEALKERLRRDEEHVELLRQNSLVQHDKRRALEARLFRLCRGLEQMRADGLDIDDATTAPVWTGKVHDSQGRVLFDLARKEQQP